MFFFKALKGLKSRRSKAVLRCESLEGRQLLTRGFFSGLSPMGGFDGPPQMAQRQSYGTSGGFGGGAWAGQNARGGFAGASRGGGAIDAFSGMAPGAFGMNGGPGLGGRSMGRGPMGRFSAMRSQPFSAPTFAVDAASADAATPTVAPTDATTPVVAQAAPTAPDFAPPPFLDAFGSSQQADAPGYGMPFGGSKDLAAPSQGIDLTNEAVKTAVDDLRTALEPIFSAKRPTHASTGALLDDLEAIDAGTLTGDEAAAKLKADQSAILTSAGATTEQIDEVLAKVDALRTAVDEAGGDATSVTILGPIGAPGGMPGPGGGQFGPGGGHRMGPMPGGPGGSGGAWGGPRWGN